MYQCSIAEIPFQTRTFDWRLGVRTAPEQLRHVLIAFQYDMSDNQDNNPSLFDHLSPTEVSVVLNDTKYPARDVIADFKKHRYVEYNKMFTEFARDYYGMDPLAVRFIDIITYKEEFPVFYFDVSKQSERVRCRSKCCGICTRHHRSTTQIPKRWEDECNILVCKCRPLITTVVDVESLR